MTFASAMTKMVAARLNMPIYEYYCPECDAKFDLLRRISQVDEAGECPDCHYMAERVLSAFSCRTTTPAGKVAPVAGTSSACGSCASTSCSSCG